MSDIGVATLEKEEEEEGDGKEQTSGVFDEPPLR